MGSVPRVYVEDEFLNLLPASKQLSAYGQGHSWPTRRPMAVSFVAYAVNGRPIGPAD